MALFRVRPLAWREINAYLDYLEEEAGLETAERFLDELMSSFQVLADMPKMGFFCGFRKPSTRRLRRWPVSGGIKDCQKRRDKPSQWYGRCGMDTRRRRPPGRKQVAKSRVCSLQARFRSARNLVGFVAEHEPIGEEAVRTLQEFLKRRRVR